MNVGIVSPIHPPRSTASTWRGAMKAMVQVMLNIISQIAAGFKTQFAVLVGLATESGQPRCIEPAVPTWKQSQRFGQGIATGQPVGDHLVGETPSGRISRGRGGRIRGAPAMRGAGGQVPVLGVFPGFHYPGLTMACYHEFKRHPGTGIQAYKEVCTPMWLTSSCPEMPSKTTWQWSPFSAQGPVCNGWQVRRAGPVYLC